MKAIITSLFIAMSFIGCGAVVDKALQPLDKATYAVEDTYTDITNTTSEWYDSAGDYFQDVGASYCSNSVVKFFSDENSTIACYEKYFVKWDGRYANYDAKKIILTAKRKWLMKSENRYITKDWYENLSTTQRLQILTQYFFEQLKKKYLEEFHKKHPKPKRDEFLTDRENLKKAYEYNLALKDLQHKWNLELNENAKIVAAKVFSAYYGTPLLEYKSYDPYEEEIYFKLHSSKEKFELALKKEVDKEQGKKLSAIASKLKPTVYLTLKGFDVVGVVLRWRDLKMLVEVTDEIYTRDYDFVMDVGEVSMKNEEIRYKEMVKNFTPPPWFGTLKPKQNSYIGYGIGYTQDEAIANAREDLAAQKKIYIRSTYKSNTKVTNGKLSKEQSAKTTQKVDAKIKVHIVKVEKKDSLWCVAVEGK